jgi:glycosyltransferase involved in cell wall biosynthesis
VTGNVCRTRTATRALLVLPTLSAGGAQSFVANLAVELNRAGVCVVVFLFGGTRGRRGQLLADKLTASGVRLVGGDGVRNIRSPATPLRLAILISRWRPHIVQANLYAAEVICAAAKVLSHGSGSVFLRRLASTEQCGYPSAAVVRLMDRLFPFTIACSPAVARSYRDFMGGHHRSRVLTILNGVELRDRVPTPAEKAHAKQALGIACDALVITHVGSMHPGAGSFCGGIESGPKGHDILLRSFEQAFPGQSKTVLVSVGDGPLRGEIQALADALGIGSRVRLLGEQPEPWLALAAADIFSFPSRWEGMPNALVEAASCGLPVVATDIPEIRALSPGPAWRLVPLNDIRAFSQALRTVAAGRTDCAALAATATDRLKARFSMRKCALRYRRAYNMVASGGHRDA